MMIDHRHEHEVGAAIRERKHLCRALPVDHVSSQGLTASLIDHFPGGIYTDDLDAEMFSQYLGKAPCAAAEVDNQRYRSAVDMNRKQILPEPKRFRSKGARLVVGPGYIGLVVVHCGDDPDQRLADYRLRLP
jgi:hypothetical protein